MNKLRDIGHDSAIIHEEESQEPEPKPDNPLLGKVRGEDTNNDDLLYDYSQPNSTDAYLRPAEPTFKQQWEHFKLYAYRKTSKGTRIFGRSFSQWAFLGGFYLLFTAGLAATLAIFLPIFYLNVSITTPKLWNAGSIMTDHDNSVSSPGMGIRPMPDYNTALITFRANKPETYKFYTDHVQAFLKSYQQVNARDDIRRKDCSENSLPDKEMACIFRPEIQLGDCGKIDSQAAIGYDEGNPCVIMKLNKIYGWQPTPITCFAGDQNETSSCDGLTPTEMTWFSEVGRPGVPLHHLFNGLNVPVTCEGRSAADIENILSIEWEPQPLLGSFPSYFYPFWNQRGYLAPLVGAQFNVTRGILLMIRCRAWAKNIPNTDASSLDGAVQFELMVD